MTTSYRREEWLAALIYCGKIQTWFTTMQVEYEKRNQKINLDHLLHVVMLLGSIYKLLQAWDLLIVLAILLEFFILFYSCQPTCKPVINKLANESIINQLLESEQTSQEGVKKRVKTLWIVVYSLTFLIFVLTWSRHYGNSFYQEKN